MVKITGIIFIADAGTPEQTKQITDACNTIYAPRIFVACIGNKQFDGFNLVLEQSKEEVYDPSTSPSH